MTEEQLNAAIAAFRAETEDIIPAVILQWYFNGGTPNYTPYTNTAQALSVIGTNWKPYMMVNVDGVDYWFLPDGSLVPYVESISLTNKSVTMEKIADLAALSVVGNPTGSAATPQAITFAALKILLGIVDYTNALNGKVDKVAGKVLITESLISKIHDPHSDDQDLSGIITDITTIYALIESLSPPYKIVLPSADTVAGRLVGLTEGVNYPTGWVLTADDKDLIVTHGLDREVKEVTIWSKNTLESIKRKEIGNAAYSGLYYPIGGSTIDSVVIESLARVNSEITIYISFS